MNCLMDPSSRALFDADVQGMTLYDIECTSSHRPRVLLVMSVTFISVNPILSWFIEFVYNYV